MIDTILKLWRVGHEHQGAWTAALGAIERGESYLDAARAFADETSHEIDDEAVETLAELLEQAVDALHQAANALGRGASMLELYAPSVLHTARRAGVCAIQIANRLDALKAKNAS